MKKFYTSQLRIWLQVIERLQFSSNPKDVVMVSQARVNVARYQAKLAELEALA